MAKNKKATINPQNNNKCFQYALHVLLNYQNILSNYQNIKIKKNYLTIQKEYQKLEIDLKKTGKILKNIIKL